MFRISGTASDPPWVPLTPTHLTSSPQAPDPKVKRIQGRRPQRRSTQACACCLAKISWLNLVYNCHMPYNWYILKICLVCTKIMTEILQNYVRNIPNLWVEYFNIMTDMSQIFSAYTEVIFCIFQNYERPISKLCVEYFKCISALFFFMSGIYQTYISAYTKNIFCFFQN